MLAMIIRMDQYAIGSIELYTWDWCVSDFLLYGNLSQ
jgi:hypothetical protein